MLNDFGDFLWNMESFYVGDNVTNAVVINDNELLLSLHSGTEDNRNKNKLVILNLETKKEDTIIDEENSVYFLDVCKIPG